MPTINVDLLKYQLLEILTIEPHFRNATIILKSNDNTSLTVDYLEFLDYIYALYLQTSTSDEFLALEPEYYGFEINSTNVDLILTVSDNSDLLKLTDAAYGIYNKLVKATCTNCSFIFDIQNLSVENQVSLLSKNLKMQSKYTQGIKSEAMKQFIMKKNKRFTLMSKEDLSVYYDLISKDTSSLYLVNLCLYFDCFRRPVKLTRNWDDMLERFYFDLLLSLLEHIVQVIKTSNIRFIVQGVDLTDKLVRYESDLSKELGLIINKLEPYIAKITHKTRNGVYSALIKPKSCKALGVDFAILSESFVVDFLYEATKLFSPLDFHVFSPTDPVKEVVFYTSCKNKEMNVMYLSYFDIMLKYIILSLYARDFAFIN